MKERVTTLTTDLQYVKRYGTAFEGINFENNIAYKYLFELLCKTYKRRGYLKVGEHFFQYDEYDNYKRFIYGEVTGTNTYKVHTSWYIIGNLLISFDPKEYSDVTVKASEKQLLNAKYVGRSIFKKKDYIPYENNVDIVLKVHLYKSISIEIYEKCAEMKAEMDIINFVLDHKDTISKSAEAMKTLFNNGVYSELVEDITPYTGHKKFAATKIDHTPYFLVMYSSRRMEY